MHAEALNGEVAGVGRSGSRTHLLSYPNDQTRRAQLAAERKPRLLLVEPGYPPPLLLDDLEDWIRYPIEADELDARLAELERRWDTALSPQPISFHDGVLRVGEKWTTISASQWPVLQLLVERKGAVVKDEEIDLAYASPNKPATRSMMRRLGARLAEVGLVVHKVRGRGYLLELEHQK